MKSGDTMRSAITIRSIVAFTFGYIGVNHPDFIVWADNDSLVEVIQNREFIGSPDDIRHLFSDDFNLESPVGQLTIRLVYTLIHTIPETQDL